MNPNDFFIPLEGQSLLYPGQNEIYRGQCVQSVMLWLKATGTEPPIYSSAYLYYVNGIPGYEQVPVGQPIKAGDIVVWRKDFPPSGGNGHIDVATGDGTINSFTAWDSNWYPPLQLKPITHNQQIYNQYIAGYLRKGGSMAADSLNEGEITAIYQLAFDNGDVPADLINAYKGKPLDGLLQQLQSDPSYAKHYEEVNNPKSDNYKPYDGSELFVKK